LLSGGGGQVNNFSWPLAVGQIYKKQYNLIRMEKNKFWAVYDKNGKVITISKDKRTAQEQALRQSNYRWTYQTFSMDWKSLEKDGYKTLESIIAPRQIKSIENILQTNGQPENN